MGLWREGIPIAIAPLYFKGHSYGEFVFDQIFARLATDIGLNYYPKLLGMSQLSPVEGYRFFYAPNEDYKKLTGIMMNAIDKFAINNGILSCNFLYVDSTWQALAESANCAKWINQTSLWLDEESKTFSDYLIKFNSNQRRNIKKERMAVKKAGIKIDAITGRKINKQIMQTTHSFYENHCKRWGPWGSKYLSKPFFEDLSTPEQRDQIVLFSAHREDPKNPIAMSLCIKDKNMI